jgi:hypothetical protein
MIPGEDHLPERIASVAEASGAVMHLCRGDDFCFSTPQKEKI